MKKLKTIVAGFLLFNFISVAAILACDATMTVNGETCSYTGTYNGFCWYSCASGAGGFKPVKGGGNLSRKVTAISRINRYPGSKITPRVFIIYEHQLLEKVGSGDCCNKFNFDSCSLLLVRLSKNICRRDELEM